MTQAQPQWLVAFARALRDRGLTVAEMVAGEGRLLIRLGDPGTAQLVATIRPVSSGARGWTATRRFVLGYDGARDLDRQSEACMQVVLTVLRHVERHLPPGLEQAATLFAESADPQDRFLKTYRFCTVERSRVGDEELVEVLVRTTDRCNQRCPFCSGPSVGHPSEDSLEACIRDAGAAFPGAMLTLTGGEPTLRASFRQELRLALDTPAISRVHVQTNAVAFAKERLVAEFPPSDRLSFFVSMHALDEALYDECTGTQGQLGPALEGLRNLIDAGHRVFINVVVNQINIGHLDAYMRGLRDTVPWNDRVMLHFSSLTCPEFRPEAASYLVPYSELAPALEGAFRLGQTLGLRMQPLRSSTHASLPACMLGPSYRDAARRPKPRDGETGYEDFARPWVKAQGCRDCSETETCLGVPRPYAERIGLHELTPFERA